MPVPPKKKKKKHAENSNELEKGKHTVNFNKPLTDLEIVEYLLELGYAIAARIEMKASEMKAIEENRSDDEIPF